MIHEHGFWLSETEVKTHTCDSSLKRALTQMFDVDSVIDIGCGNGEYTQHFLDHGISCIGYDGSPLTPEITEELCSVKDFAVPQDVGQFDLVLSLEVGEHIPQKYERVFLDNICRAARKYVCLSWAIIGQGGTGHVNCRDNWYVIQEMRKREFEFEPVMSQKLRDHSTFSWFKNTLMCYTKNH